MNDARQNKVLLDAAGTFSTNPGQPQGGLNHPNMATLGPNFDPLQPTELLSIVEVEERVKMKRSNIYRLIQQGLFPAPIHLGGSKWIAAEVEEYIQRRKDERERQHGQNKFAPRPAVLSAAGPGSPSESVSDGGPRASVIPHTSEVRLLEPGLCQALRMLRIEIPELYLDPDAWNVSLAVVKVELSPDRQTTKERKGKRR